MSSQHLYIDKVTCIKPTDQSIGNDRDEMYFLVAGASTAGKKIRVSPNSSEDYYGLSAGQSTGNILLAQKDLAEGEHVVFTIAICEQDNAQLGALGDLVEAIGLTIATILAEDPDLGEQAVEKWIQTGVGLAESVMKSGDQVIGVFGVRLTVDHGNVQAKWVPMKHVTITSSGEVKASLKATGSKAEYQLVAEVLDPVLVTWTGNRMVITDTAVTDVALARPEVLGVGQVYGSALVRTADDHIRNLLWAVDDADSFVEKNRLEATPATHLALAAAQLSNGNLLGALRDKDTHRLKVVVWNIDYTGAVSRLDAALADVIDQVAVTRIPGHLAATACTQAGQKLGIAVWDCILKTGTTAYTVKRLGDNTQAEPVRAARVAAACWAKGLVTAIQDPDTNHLKLIAWHVTDDFTVVKKAMVTAEIEVDRIAIVNVSQSNDDPRNRFATAVRKTDGSMQVNVWDVAADASAIHLRDVDAPPSPANIKDVAITSMGALYASDLKLSTGQIATAAIRNIDNKYRLTSWTVSANGKLSRTVDITSAEVKRVTLDFLHTINLQRDFASTPLYEIFSAVEFTDGKLGLLKWSAFVDPIVPTAGVMVSGAIGRHGAVHT